MVYPSYPVYVEKVTAGKYNRVYINSKSVERDLNNSLIKITLPVVPNKQDTYDPQTRIMNLQRIMDVITITGSIESQHTTKSGTQGVPNAQLTATEATDLLISGILYREGDITLYWRGLPSGKTLCIADKLKITDSAQRADSYISGGGIQKFDIIFTVTLGTTNWVAK